MIPGLVSTYKQMKAGASLESIDLNKRFQNILTISHKQKFGLFFQILWGNKDLHKQKPPTNVGL